ncbi:MAG: CDP-glycerol glycerophosphotransferase family protein [Lachnospiraceae bacterium]|nr:CDP-glycerol glycerophosphotransferase family protein [Lachnospiraceae bacterium]
MKQIINGMKYWGQLLLLPIYWLSFLFPRDKHIWLFGSTFGRRFADNPRYLYLYVSQHSDRASEQVKASRSDWKKSGHAFTEDENCKRIRPIWISHDKGIARFLNENGYEAYYYHSLKGIWYALRGKVYLFDNYSKDINFWLSGGAVKINLWHGVGNKCINYDNKHDKVRHPKNGWERFKYFPRCLSDEKPSHYILTTSPMMSEIFARAFQVPESHVIETGYPRNDILFKECNLQNLYQKEEEILMQHIEEWKVQRKTILGYLPTFRPSEVKFFEVCDLAKFNSYLKTNNMVLVCKLHPKSVCKEAFEKIEYSHIYNVPAEVDVNCFLGKLDLLIADYSSVYSDYMLLDRPVVAFHYDYEEYSMDTRDAYFDFEEYMPEVRACNQAELEASIQKVLQRDEAAEKRKAFRGRLYKDVDYSSAKRFLSRMVSLYG